MVYVNMAMRASLGACRHGHLSRPDVVVRGAVGTTGTARPQYIVYRLLVGMLVTAQARLW
jgi:hypothetical protein